MKRSDAAVHIVYGHMRLASLEPIFPSEDMPDKASHFYVVRDGLLVSIRAMIAESLPEDDAWRIIILPEHATANVVCAIPVGRAFDFLYFDKNLPPRSRTSELCTINIIREGEGYKANDVGAFPIENLYNFFT
jgi:hypothetical protein